ncbi:MAG: heme ABC transporter permease [Alphaproteobacteria bacterium]|nr:heme ABC transporter permease [Alphaproteobacteria bacterium]
MIKHYDSLKIFYPLAGRLMPWFGWAFALLGIFGLYWGLFLAPIDAVQGEAYRIMFVHVPSAWMSLMIYAVMTICAITILLRRSKIAEYWLLSSSSIGASFTFLTLVTGSLWGRPMWGTWWVWDARLTSELILLFVYLGIIALGNAIPEKRKAAQAVSMLTVVGSINLPIIKFSVDWWTTLHQPASIFRAGGSAIHPMMLTALLLMAASFTCYYFWLILWRVRIQIRENKQ